MKWYYKQDDKEIGPITQTALNELATAGIISEETPVRGEDSTEWKAFSPSQAGPPQPPGQTAEESIEFSCPKCNASISTNASYAGRSGNCPSCGGEFVIPSANPPQTPAQKKPAKRLPLKRILLGAAALMLFIGISVAVGVRKAFHNAVADQLVQKADEVAFKSTGNQDWDRAFSLLNEAVAMGSHEAEYKLGSCYFYGRGVSQDTEQAIRLFRDAAEGGYPDAQFNLAMCYQKGTGVSRNEKEMLKWMQLAAEQDLPQAQLCLGQLYLFGRLVPQDQEKGIGLITSAANQGFAQAQYHLALSYMVGDGVPKDPVEAAKWIILAGCSGLPKEAMDTQLPGGGRALETLQSQLTEEQLNTAEQMATEWQSSRKNP